MDYALNQRDGLTDAAWRSPITVQAINELVMGRKSWPSSISSKGAQTRVLFAASCAQPKLTDWTRALV
ncbi:hypothetical protein LHA01_27870 [Schleiferilactobacillus harbinensis]|nr:hypothetical protein LHA01_27870 [Schleiferilactobacillus harbinensis]